MHLVWWTFLGGFADFDLWGTIGIQLPDILWQYSAYIKLATGAFMFKIGYASTDEEPQEGSPSSS